MNENVSHLPHSDLTIIVVEGDERGKKKESSFWFFGRIILLYSFLTFRRFLFTWNVFHGLCSSDQLLLFLPLFFLLP